MVRDDEGEDGDGKGDDAEDCDDEEDDKVSVLAGSCCVSLSAAVFV